MRLLIKKIFFFIRDYIVLYYKKLIRLKIYIQIKVDNFFFIIWYSIGNNHKLSKIKKLNIDNKKILVLRNFFHSKVKNIESMEKYHLDHHLIDLDFYVENFFYDNNKPFFFKQIYLYKLINKFNPKIIIISSYRFNYFNYPSIELLMRIKKNIKSKIIMMWWDSCNEKFIDSIYPILKNDIVDLHICPDNPILDINFKDITLKEKKKFIPEMFTAEPTFLYKPGNNDFYDVVFLGQVGSYRNYRKEYLDYLKENKKNLNMFISEFNKDLQISNEEHALILGKSKIGLNFSYSLDKHQIKGRICYTMLSGALLLESKNKQIESMFEEGKDYISFISKEDMLKKIHYYLNNEKERRKIAENGRNKVLQKYNGKILWNKIFNHLDFS